MEEKEFPANSRKARAKTTTASEGVEEARVTRIIEGTVDRKKQPMLRRFTGNFIENDAKTVGSTVFQEVLVPAFKDTIINTVTETVERMLGVDTRRGRRGSGMATGVVANVFGHQAYGSMFRGGAAQQVASSVSRRARATHSFDEIILTSRVEAEEVLNGMYATLEKFEVVRVRDLYDMLGESSNYQDDRFGWLDLRGSRVTRRGGNYHLILPDTVELVD